MYLSRIRQHVMVMLGESCDSVLPQRWDAHIHTTTAVMYKILRWTTCCTIYPKCQTNSYIHIKYRMWSSPSLAEDCSAYDLTYAKVSFII